MNWRVITISMIKRAFGLSLKGYEVPEALKSDDTGPTSRSQTPKYPPPLGGVSNEP